MLEDKNVHTPFLLLTKTKKVCNSTRKIKMFSCLVEWWAYSEFFSFFLSFVWWTKQNGNVGNKIYQNQPGFEQWQHFFEEEKIMRLEFSLGIPFVLVLLFSLRPFLSSQIHNWKQRILKLKYKYIQRSEKNTNKYLWYVCFCLLQNKGSSNECVLRFSYLCFCSLHSFAEILMNNYEFSTSITVQLCILRLGHSVWQISVRIPFTYNIALLNDIDVCS